MKNVPGFGYLLLSALFLTCTTGALNPYDPEYQGDYRLTVRFPTESSLELFRPYHVRYTQGSDAFLTVRISSTPVDLVDTAYFAATRTADSLGIYFRKTGTGVVRVTGISPNGMQRISDSFAVSVANPYALRGDTLLIVGQRASCSISYTGRHPASGPVPYVAWSVRGEEKMLLPFASSFEVITGDTLEEICAALVDLRNNRSDPLCRVGRLWGTKPSITSLQARPDPVNAGAPVTVTVQATGTDSTSNAVRLIAVSHNRRDSLVKSVGRFPVSIVWDSVFTDTGSVTLRCVVVSKAGIVSDTATARVRVVANPPAISFVSSSDTISVPINTEVIIQATPGAARYVWRYRDRDTTTMIPEYKRIFFSGLGAPELLIVRGIDAFGYTGAPDSVYLLPRNYAYMLAWKSRPADTVHCDSAFWSVGSSTEQQARTKGAKYRWRFEKISAAGAAVILDTIGDTLTGIRPKLPDTSRVRVTVVLSDTLGDSSAVLRHETYATKFRPLISAVAGASTAGTRQPVTVTVSAAAMRGRQIAAIYRQLPGKAADTVSRANPVFAVSFDIPGAHVVKVWARDTDNQVSDTSRVTITVTSGAPIIDSLRILTGAPHYIKAPVTVRIIARDNNPAGRLTQYRIVARRDGDSLVFDSADDIQSLSFARDRAGTYSLSVRVKNQDEQWSPVHVHPVPVQINQGIPVVHSITPDTVWAHDLVTFLISASDSNGTVRGLRIDWGDGTVDSVAVNGQSVVQPVKHTYQPTGTNFYTVLIRAWDNDSIVSAERSRRIVVRKGMPTLSIHGAGSDTRGDTLFVPYWRTFFGRERIDSSRVRLFANDTNGTIVRYYLKVGAPFDTTTAIKTYENPMVIQWPLRSVNQDTAYRAVAWVRDDDGYMARDSFFLHTDGAPDYLWITAPEWDDTLGDSTTIVWQGGLDARDGMDTEFRILVCRYNDTNGRDIDTTVAMTWTAAKNLSPEPTGYQGYPYRFSRRISTGQWSPQIRIRVTARDRNGLTSAEYSINPRKW